MVFETIKVLERGRDNCHECGNSLTTLNMVFSQISEFLLHFMYEFWAFVVGDCRLKTAEFCRRMSVYKCKTFGLSYIKMWNLTSSIFCCFYHCKMVVSRIVFTSLGLKKQRILSCCFDIYLCLMSITRIQERLYTGSENIPCQ